MTVILESVNYFSKKANFAVQRFLLYSVDKIIKTGTWLYTKPRRS